MITVNFISAFVGGLVTFLAPCTLPLIPAYIGFLGGMGREYGEAKDPRELKRRIMINALLFTIGFSLVFIFIGMVSGTLGKFYIRHNAVFSEIGGVLIIIFGLAMLGALPLPRFLNFIGKLFQGRKLPQSLSPGHPFSAFVLGLLFALGLGPTCLGPILGYISLLAVSSGTVLYGASLLFVYSLGIAVPFLVVAFLYGTAFTYVTKLARYLPIIAKCAGILLIVIGVLLIIGQFGIINMWAESLFGSEWYNALMQYM